MLSKRRQSEVWIDWSKQQIHHSLRRSWNVRCRQNSGCLSLSRSMGLRTLRTTLTPSRRCWAFQQPFDEILCRSFPTTFKGAAREWFTKLPTSSVDSFEQLSNAFLRHFIGGQHPKRPADHLLTIRQGEKETLRLYVKCFTRKTLEVDEADDKV